MPWDFLNSDTSQSTIALSKLSPPRWLSPAVDLTSNTPSPISSTDTSKVPPPRSKTRIVWSDSLSRPYASDAAVGSLMMRLTSRPAILPASLVAWRWSSLKYAGTVMTAQSTVSPRYASASDFSFCRIIAEISGGRVLLDRLVFDAGVAVGTGDDLVGDDRLLLAYLGLLAAHEALDREDGVLRVGHSLALGDRADEALAGAGEGDNGRGRATALGVLDHGRLAALQHGHARVGRAEVDAYCLGHVGLLHTYA